MASLSQNPSGIWAAILSFRINRTSKWELVSYKSSTNTPIQAEFACIWPAVGVDGDNRAQPFLLSLQHPNSRSLIPNLDPGLTKALNIGITFSSVFCSSTANKTKKLPLSLVLGLALSPAPSRESGLGATLAVRVRPWGAGVWVWFFIIAVFLRQAFLPYSPVSGTEASQ